MEISDPTRSFSARTRPSRKLAGCSRSPKDSHADLFPHSIIDGSGTIHDPLGLDREELIRLAKARKMISNFDASKLSKDGYRVLVDDRDLTLPCMVLLSPPI